MSIAIVMLTFDRRPQAANYLAETLRNLQRAGTFTSPALHSFHLVDSGSAHASEFLIGAARDAGVTLPLTCHSVPEKITANANAARALRIGSQTGAEWVLFVEDDIDVIDDFLGAVEMWLSRHGDGYLLHSFGAAYASVKRFAAMGEDLWPYPVAAFYGTQAFAMRAEVAADAADALDKIQLTWDTGQGYDLQLKKWAAKKNVTHFSASCPSFVQHIGKESALHLGRFHIYDSWPGRDYRYTPEGVVTR